MKKHQLLTLLFMWPLLIIAQEEQSNTIYRRSSLYTMMINEPNRQYADVIAKTFTESPIPDKFNDHLLPARSIDNAIPPGLLSKEEKTKIQRTNISNYLEANHVARDMVAKWFNRTAKGTFNVDLISERGSYNASEMDVQLAKSSKRGLSMLADAGEELINNTFVIVNDFDYISKEKAANIIKSGISLLKEVAILINEDADTTKGELAEIGLTVAGKGYVVITTSYLYQLEWNDSIAAVFYEEYWMDNDSYSTAKKLAFEHSDIFKLKYIGYETAWADLQSTIFTTKTEEQLVEIATVRAIDAVIARLQRKFEVFRTKTPLYNNDPLAAKIGLKEGLEKGDKYEVLEQVMDKEGKTRYKRRGVIKVDKDHIWDNRFMAAEEHQLTDNLIPTENYTIFKGDSKYYVGWLIRQIN